MKNLKHYQELFLKSVLKSEDAPELLDLVKPIGNLDSMQALDIYREDYDARIDSVMRENFKATWLVLGDEDYAQAVCEYKQKHPPAHPDLGKYGEHFPLFLEHSVYRKKFPMLKDLAQLEWDSEQIFHQDYPHYPDPFNSFPETALAKAVFQFHPSLKSYAWDFALYGLLESCQNPDQKTFEKLDFARPQYLLLYKVGELIRTKELHPSQWQVMELLQAEYNLEYALENVSCRDPNLIEELFSFLRTSGLVIGLS